MLKLSLHFTLILTLLSFCGARTINLSRAELEAISKAINVALHAEPNEKHKLLEQFNGNSDPEGVTELNDDDNDNIENGPSNGSNNGNRNGNNGNNNGHVYFQIFIGNQVPIQPPETTWTPWPTGTTWPTGFPPTEPPWTPWPTGTTWPTDWPTGTTWSQWPTDWPPGTTLPPGPPIITGDPPVVTTDDAPSSSTT